MLSSSHGNNLRDTMTNEWSTPTSMDAEAHSTVVCSMNFHPLVIVRLAKCHYCKRVVMSTIRTNNSRVILVSFSNLPLGFGGM